MPGLMRTFTLASWVATALAAADYGPVMEVARTNWPGRTHLAVVARYSHSAEEIQALAEAAGPDRVITVVDCPGALQLESARAFLVRQVKPDILVLLEDDPLVRAGNLEATRLVGTASLAGVPTIATRPIAVRQGAVFAVGPETGMELVEADHLTGTVNVVLPPRGSHERPVSSLHRPAAPILVLAAR